MFVFIEESVKLLFCCYLWWPKDLFELEMAVRTGKPVIVSVSRRSCHQRELEDGCKAASTIKLAKCNGERGRELDLYNASRRSLHYQS